MAAILVDPQTTKSIIKDFTTTQQSSFQLGHKYKLNKMTIDRIGRDHLGVEIYSKREELAFASLCDQIRDLQSRNYSIATIADTLGVSKTSLFEIIRKIKAQSPQEQAPANLNEVEIISIGSKMDEPHKATAEITATSAVEVDVPAKTEHLSLENYHRKRSLRKHNRPNQSQSDYRDSHGYIKIKFKDLQISFNPAQKEATDVIVRLISELKA